MTGHYRRKDGVIFDVIFGKKGLERGNRGKYCHNRLFTKVTSDKLKEEIKSNWIRKFKDEPSKRERRPARKVLEKELLTGEIERICSEN